MFLQTNNPTGRHRAYAKIMSPDPRYHSAFPVTADLAEEADAARHAARPSKLAYESPDGILPLEPLVKVAEAIGGLATDVAVAAKEVAIGLAAKVAPAIGAANAVQLSKDAMGRSGGLGTGNPDIDPAAVRAASEGRPGHGRMDVMGEKQSGKLTGAGTHPRAASESYAHVATPRGAGLKSPSSNSDLAGASGRRGYATSARLHSPPDVDKYSGGASSSAASNRARFAGRDDYIIDDAGNSVPLPESVGAMQGTAEAVAQLQEFYMKEGGPTSASAGVKIDRDVPVGPSAAGEASTPSYGVNML